MVLEGDHFLGHLLHLKCLLELVLLHQILLPLLGITLFISLCIRWTWVLSRYRFLIFWPNMAHIGQLGIIEIATALFRISTVFINSFLSPRITLRWGCLRTILLHHYLDCFSVSINEWHEILLPLFVSFSIYRLLYHFRRLISGCELRCDSYNLVFFGILRS